MLGYGIAYQDIRGRRKTPRWWRSLQEQIDGKNKKHPACDEKCRDEKVGGVVSFVTTMSRRDQMSLGIVCMV
jgi:hypothetical protein